MRQIRGKKDCPFAWRARIVAREKDLPFTFVESEGKSPTLVEDGFTLTESLVIMSYLDEAHPGNDLQALGARERALMRLRSCELAILESKPEEGLPVLERMLAHGRQWLGGSRPDLSDIAIWPFLWTTKIPPELKRVAAYWSRARERESLTSTSPSATRAR